MSPGHLPEAMSPVPRISVEKIQRKKSKLPPLGVGLDVRKALRYLVESGSLVSPSLGRSWWAKEMSLMKKLLGVGYTPEMIRDCILHLSTNGRRVDSLALLCWQNGKLLREFEAVYKAQQARKPPEAPPIIRDPKPLSSCRARNIVFSRGLSVRSRPILGSPRESTLSSGEIADRLKVFRRNLWGLRRRYGQA